MPAHAGSSRIRRRPLPVTRCATAFSSRVCRPASSRPTRRSHMPLTKSGPPIDIRPATGKLGVLCPGMGAVATTFIAGVEAIRRGCPKPVGSLTQMGTIRLGKRTDNRVPRIKDFVPLAALDDLVFGGWDIFPDNAYEAATQGGRARATSTSTELKRLPRRRSSRCRRCSTELRQEAARRRTSRRARPSATWPSSSSTTSRASRRRTAATGW